MTTTGAPPDIAEPECRRPGCTGTIQDGYCNVCGLMPVEQSAGPSSGSQTGAGPSGPVSPGPGAASSGTASASSVTTGTAGVALSVRISRGHLGAGLVEITPIPERDPVSALMADPQVPESKRFCGACSHPVGRSRDGRPGLTDGFCPHCRAQFSFSPKLAPGEMVYGQYEVLGCLAHGGMGWIYLGVDHHLDRRPVVLKGLLNSGDSAAQEAAVAERRFLAEVKHPNIVDVYNFVQHPDSRSGALTGYIVMEYVGGRSLREILLDRRTAMGQPLPLADALAYAIEVLPALGYLHNRGLVYCDFKPDNVMQTEEQLQLIDMGGVRRIDDEESPILGTEGFQAPEIATLGPSPSSDLYTVGRTLAVLTFEFAGFQSTYMHSLPDPATVPVLAANDSYARALRRATNPEPGQRFASAGEMGEQLTGVLREVVSVASGEPHPAYSTLFSAEAHAIGAPATGAEQGAPSPAEVVSGLPVPVVDSSDPAAGFLATLSTLEPEQLISVLVAAVDTGLGAPPEVAESIEARLALARAVIVSGDLSAAQAPLDYVAARRPADWRITWYQGLLALANADPDRAGARFEAVLDVLPGELAPKLALGLTAESAGEYAKAARFLSVVWTVDRSFVSAAFGLARVRAKAGDIGGAVGALSAVPLTSSQYLSAQVAALRMRLRPLAGQDWVSGPELQAATRQFARLRPDPELGERLKTELLQAALSRVLGGQPVDASSLPGVEPTERAVRFGLEKSYREQARLVPDADRRIALVDLANTVRPRTWS